MSRIGKQPIEIPSAAKVEIQDGVLIAQGPKGRVSQELFEGFNVEIDGNVLTVHRPSESGSDRSRHGLLRSLLSNAIEGVATGFSKQLEIVGVGYRAEVQERSVSFALGYSHPVIYPIPDGIEVEIDKAGKVTVTGADRQKVGQVAAEIRNLRRPDPYKGKGIKYADEIIRRKVGKAGAK